MPLKSIKLTESTCFDKFTKITTIIFVLIGILLSVLISVLHFSINLKSNQQIFDEQAGLISYVSLNVRSNPIKYIYFRDLFCDDAEETAGLFPWKNSKTLNYWQSQVICIERFKSINYTSASGQCMSGSQKCGIYCLPANEGTTCPISKVYFRLYGKILIKPTNSTQENATQTLSHNRSLYVYRDTTQVGLYRIEVDIDTFPCMNDYERNLGGLSTTLGVMNSSTCDSYGFDSQNSLRVEQFDFKSFLTDNMAKMNTNISLASVKNNPVAYLTQRYKLEIQVLTNQQQQCRQIQYTKLYQIQNYSYNIDQVAILYVYINSIISGLLLIIFFMELVILRCRVHRDLKILTVLLKMLIIVQLTFVEIEGSNFFRFIKGGLILHQIYQKEEIDQYFINFAKLNCFPQSNVANIFKNFPDLFSADLAVFIQFVLIVMIIFAALIGILILLYFAQMVKWCHSKKHDIQLKPRKYMDDDLDRIRSEVVASVENGLQTDRIAVDVAVFPHLKDYEMSKVHANKKSQKY